MCVHPLFAVITMGATAHTPQHEWVNLSQLLQTPCLKIKHHFQHNTETTKGQPTQMPPGCKRAYTTTPSKTTTIENKKTLSQQYWVSKYEPTQTNKLLFLVSLPKQHHQYVVGVVKNLFYCCLWWSFVSLRHICLCAMSFALRKQFAFVVPCPCLRSLLFGVVL